MQLHPLHREGTPPNPCRPVETRRLRHLAGVQYRQERRVDHEGLGIADQLGQDGAAQGFQKAPELPESAMEGARGKARHPRKEVYEEPLGIAQEGPLALHAPQLLEEGKGQDLGIRELLERLRCLPRGLEHGSKRRL